MSSDNYTDLFRRELLTGYVKQFRRMIAQLVNRYNQNNVFNEDDIDDLLQECIVVLYEKGIDPTFRLTAKASTFVYSVAQNKLREKLKKLNRYQEVPFESEIGEMALEEYDVAQDELKERQKSILRECIKLLSETQRQVFILFSYHNFSMKQIADRFNSNENSMKSQKYKAQENIRECVKRKQLIRYE